MRRTNTMVLVLVIASSFCVGCNADAAEEDGPWVTCTNDRLVEFVIEGKDFDSVEGTAYPGMHQARSDPSGGYYLYASQIEVGWDFIRVDHDGKVGEKLRIPSDLGPRSSDLAPTPDGGALLVGFSPSFSGTEAWVGNVDAQWGLTWESTWESSSREVALLPDGGAVVVGISYADNINNDPLAVSWARLEVGGGIVWERSLSLPGLRERDWLARKLSVHGDAIRVVFATDDGIQLIDSTLDGEWTQKQLDAAPLDIMDTAALPDGRLVIAGIRASSIASGAVLMMVGAEGRVEWEKVFAEGEGAQADAVAYNAGRNEILLGGSYRGSDLGAQRTWIIATDLEGKQTWELVRTPVDHHLDGFVKSVRGDQGPAIWDIATQPDGSFLATGQTANLTYFVVSAGDCGAQGG